MPEMSEKELEEMEKRCEATKAARQTLEAENEKLDLELSDAKDQLAKIQQGKDNFEAKLSETDAVIEAKRIAMKDGEKMFNREKEDFRKDMENIKQMLKDQQRAIQKDKEIEERKMKEGVDDLGVMEFSVSSLGTDITNMQRRIELQKDQLKMTQKFLEKLEKEKRDIEATYDKIRKDHDLSRQDNAAKEMENLELQLQLSPEARAQYQHEAAMREDSRPKPKKKKAKKQQRRDDEYDESEYEESSRGGSRLESMDEGSSRRRGGGGGGSRYDDEEESPRPPRKNRGEQHREKEMSILSARDRRNRDYWTKQAGMNNKTKQNKTCRDEKQNKIINMEYQDISVIRKKILFMKKCFI